MIKHIDVFLPPLSRYGVLTHFTVSVHEALLRAGIKSRLLEAKRHDPDPFIKALMDETPDCTLSFNGVLPDSEGRFLADMIKIPHVGVLVDSSVYFARFVPSTHSITTCVDEASVVFFQGLGFNRSFFLPHGVDRSISADPEGTREYDVVMLGSCIDYEGVRASWKERFTAPLRKVMEDAADFALETPSLPCYQAFVETLNKAVLAKADIDPTKIHYLAVLAEVETYLRGKDRIELVKAVKDARVDIFGASDDLKGWKDYLGDRKNVVIHDPVPFEQVLSIMKHSKIVLNSSPWIYRGVHERILSGLACGALVITNENGYLQEHFKDGESIVMFRHGKWDKVNHRVNEYLESESLRRQVAEAGRKVVMKGHTWDHRVAHLLNELPKYLKMIS